MDLPADLSQTRFVVCDYDLDATLSSGQTFRWNQRDASWQAVLGNRWVRLQRVSDGIHASTWPAAQDWDWLTRYLQLNVDLDRVLATFPPRDPHLSAAVNACRGLRLLRQDPWECLASFILSSTKQIVQIRKIIELLCQHHGKALAPRHSVTRERTFPCPATIAACSEAELRECGMGFRAPALRVAASRIAEGTLVLDDLTRLSTAEARQRLVELPGVGDKIANCVLLFAYGAQDAFPMDVWILKALRELYFHGRPVSRSDLDAFVHSHFGPRAGYAQQYLFHYMRVHLGRKTRHTPAPV
jgi:N-glycosylase/DNA lyase